MDNLRLLWLVVNVYRGTARRPRYKFIADSEIHDLMHSTYLAIIIIDKKSYMRFRLVQKSVTLNDL